MKPGKLKEQWEAGGSEVRVPLFSPISPASCLPKYFSLTSHNGRRTCQGKGYCIRVAGIQVGKSSGYFLKGGQAMSDRRGWQDSQF